MTPLRRALPLRVVLVSFGLAGLLFVAAVTIQVMLVLQPAAAELRSHSSNLLADHDVVAANLTSLRDARRQIARLVPPFSASPDPLPAVDALRDTIRVLLDRGATLHTAVVRADIPLEMRLVLAQAVEQETSVSVKLFEAIRAVELRRPQDAVDALRASGVHSDSASQLLSSAQRAALSGLLESEDDLLAEMLELERAAQRFALGGVLLFLLIAWIVHLRFYRPVQEMERTVRRVVAGDLTAVASVPRSDELGRLASHLNAMTHVLRERAEEETRKRENLTERFGRILDESANQICVFDADTLLLIQANRGARVGLGFTRDELEGRRLPDIFGGIAEERLAAILQGLRAGQSSQLVLAAWLKRKDGTLRPTEVTLQHSSDGDSAVFISVAEEAGVRQRVRELDERLRGFTITEQHALTSGDLDAALRPLTQMAAEAMGATRCGVWRVQDGRLSGLVAYDTRDEAHVTDAPAPSAAIAETPALEMPVRNSGRIVAMVIFEQVGERRTWTAEERTFAGAVADLVLRILDASERRVLEHALARAQRMDSIGQLAGGVAHDFNNILTAILGNLESCRAELPEGAPMDEALAEAEQAALRAAELTRQLLTFARNQVVETRVVDVNQQLIESEPMLRRLIGPRIVLNKTLADNLHHVRLGAGQIEQVAVNLAVNARDAMPDGGSISITTRNVVISVQRAAEIPGLTAGPHVELTVTDSGVGMDPRTVERVFEPFFTTKRMGEGTGLGLAVCYGVVRNAGGAVEVQSEPGRGATFRLYFPALLERSAAPLPPPARRSPVPGGSEVILVAEDEPAIRTLLARMLTARGYQVLVAEHGAEAVAIGASYDGEISLLVSDVVMPELGGVPAALALRAQRPGLPVLFISGFTATAAVQAGELADAAFLPKPFTPEELVRRVREVLDAAVAQSTGERPVH